MYIYRSYRLVQVEVCMHIFIHRYIHIWYVFMCIHMLRYLCKCVNDRQTRQPSPLIFPMYTYTYTCMHACTDGDTQSDS